MDMVIGDTAAKEDIRFKNPQGPIFEAVIWLKMGPYHCEPYEYLL